MDHFGKRWSFTCFKAGGNGTKQLGGALWYNSQRIGIQINFWKWELQSMRDFKKPRGICKHLMPRKQCILCKTKSK